MRQIVRIRGENREELDDMLITETPLTIFLNKVELVTILCTPEYLKELAVGYLFSEGFIKDIEDILALELDEKKSYAQVELTKNYSYETGGLSGAKTPLITPACIQFSSTVGGLNRSPAARVDSSARFSIIEITEALRKTHLASDLYKQTGGVHNAAICAGGSPLFFSEDIGRHNAIDKVIGHAMLKGIPAHDKMIVTTGRISSPVLGKIARASIPVLISRSAPTSEAARLADALGITLIGFARGRRFNIYSSAWRIDYDSSHPLSKPKLCAVSK